MKYLRDEHRRGLVVSVLLALCGLLLPDTPSRAQEVKIWEFSPYEVEVWYAFDATVNASAIARQTFVSQLQDELERTFRAAWRVQLSPLADDIANTVVRDFENFSVADLTAAELVLVVSLRNDQTKTVRTFEAALESLSEIHCSLDARLELENAVASLELPDDSPVRELVGKCVVDEGGLSSLQQKLEEATIGAALLPRVAAAEVSEHVRNLVTPLPWQIDSVLRQRDKLFFLLVGMDGDDIVCKVRELDCPMQYLGPAFQDLTSNWPYASRLASATLVRAFAPVARVEDASAKTASLRLRAGGLILNSQNPAQVHVGDVMQPIVRRDDRNGVPTLLEPLSFTFAAITDSDGVKMNANVYTYSGGPGLQGRKNRRTQRMLLRVRPVVEQTDIRITVRGDGRPQSGCFIYNRDLLTEEFEFLGRTDWRGRFSIPMPKENGGFLPEEVRAKRYLAKKQAEAEAAAAEENATTDSATTDSAGTEADATASDEPTDAGTDKPPGAAAAEPSVDEPTRQSSSGDPDILPLNFPLLQLYIKSGDTVLAKLPVVPGLKEIETAELPDDARRLQSEAFVRGFQGEILDLIGLRNLLAARIKLHLKNDKLLEAEQVMEELRRLRNYNELAKELELIQRKMLDEKEGAIPGSAKNKIDRMFQTTRDMLQKYLQDNLVDESERAIANAKKSGTG